MIFHDILLSYQRLNYYRPHLQIHFHLTGLFKEKQIHCSTRSVFVKTYFFIVLKSKQIAIMKFTKLTRVIKTVFNHLTYLSIDRAYRAHSRRLLDYDLARTLLHSSHANESC